MLNLFYVVSLFSNEILSIVLVLEIVDKLLPDHSVIDFFFPKYNCLGHFQDSRFYVSDLEKVLHFAH